MAELASLHLPPFFHRAGPDKSVRLPKGETTYPFAFPLAGDSPGSAEIPAGDRAYVRE